MKVKSCRWNSALFMGVVVVGIGVLLLLDQANLIDVSRIFRFWPMLFVVAGLFKLFTADQAPGRVWGGFLVFVGGVLQAERLNYIHIRIERLWWPLMLIGAGVILVWQALSYRRGTSGSSASSFSVFHIFGGGERRISSLSFEGGQVMVAFGGFKIDLRQADMQGTEAVIDASAVFGGGEILVPPTWTVVMDGLGLFGGYGDSTQHPPATGPTKNLIVKGLAMFGGVEVKN